MTPLHVGGLTPLTATDYPGHLAAVVFCQGCPWRCAYCHNPHLISPRASAQIEWPAVMQFLARRVGLLDAVVFSGGEPTLQSGLAQALSEVKAMGFKCGLHTAGAYPQHLTPLLPLLDWVGFDIKASFADYEHITQVRGSGNSAEASLQALLASGVSYECRTTVDLQFFDSKKLIDLAQSLAASGVRHYVLQTCRNPHTLGSQYLTQVNEWLAELANTIALSFDTFVLRPA
ncbi:MAG: anaerobic ribonucleoside-triphosphate reductase activating protein [Hydrogenophilales bacterium]|nr:anaerobic ribonucleoside-triphosphate reductase activating protein [Hydrogenophilales bacterium]